MKITTWNVNGLRAALGKGLAAWVSSESPDVLCLQEVKARPEQIGQDGLGLDEYAPVWNSAQRPGYSGVLTLMRGGHSQGQARLGLGLERFDVEGRVIETRHPGFLLFNIYFPSGQRGHDRVAYKLDFYAALLDKCDDLHKSGESIVLAGDFNTAHQPLDLSRPSQNQRTSGFLPEERAMVQRYLDHGFVDAFRFLYPERVAYTWWTYRAGSRNRNVGWRLDYFLVSATLLPRVRDVIIHDDVGGSDHCPVSLLLADESARKNIVGMPV
jgi:exodeoxyribonuclease-3